MLTKVTKYELKAAARFLLPTFGLCLAMGLVLFGLQLLPAMGGNYGTAFSFFVSFVSSAAGTLMLAAVFFLTLGVLVVRFYQAFNGAEGYLTFSLPVKTGTHLWGHLLSAAIYSLGCSVIAVTAIFLVLPGQERETLFASDTVVVDMGFGTTPLTMGDIPGGYKLLVFGGLILFLLFSLVTSLLQIYAAIAIGGQFGQNRILISVVGYFILNTVEGILVLVLSAIPVGIYMGYKGGIEQLVTGFASLPPGEQMREILILGAVFMGLLCVLMLAFAVVHFFLCRWLYTKKLNLV